jgi:Tn3 transposase DDE domain-containing protein
MSSTRSTAERTTISTNCIIYYNATVLAALLAHKEAVGDTAGVTQLHGVSPVAWQHINFHHGLTATAKTCNVPWSTEDGSVTPDTTLPAASGTAASNR